MCMTPALVSVSTMTQDLRCGGGAALLDLVLLNILNTFTSRHLSSDH